jgi:hypothetical protein
MHPFCIRIILILFIFSGVTHAFPPPVSYQRLNNGIRQTILRGRATTPSGEVGARLRLFRKEGKGGALGLEMLVFKKDQPIKDALIDKNIIFNFDDFVGGNPATANRSLVQVTVRRGKEDSTVKTDQLGMFDPDSGGFVFSVIGPNDGSASPALAIFKAVRNSGRSILFRVTDSKDANAWIQGEFQTPGVFGAARKIMAGP